MNKRTGTPRRAFLQQAALAAAAAQTPAVAQKPKSGPGAVPPPANTLSYPRVFEGRHLAMIAFPLGGVGAGSLCIGGRGQLRDWEIFNRPNKGYRPSYAFPSIWAQAGDAKPVARVLESRMNGFSYEGRRGHQKEDLAEWNSRPRSCRVGDIHRCAESYNGLSDYQHGV